MPAKHAELLNLLEQGARLCEDNPRYLSEKIPDWEDGLAMSRVNKLAGKAVYEYREQIEDGHRQRWLTFNHPDEDMPVRLEVYANRPSQSAVNRAANHIRAWKAAIAGGGKASIEAKKPAAKPRMKKEEAARKAEKYLSHHLYPGHNNLAKAIGCSASTLTEAKAISGTLRIAAAEHEEAQSKPRLREMADARLASTPVRVASPSKTADETADAVLAVLVDQATPQERAQINSLSESDRRRIAEDPGLAVDMFPAIAQRMRHGVRER